MRIFAVSRTRLRCLYGVVVTLLLMVFLQSILIYENPPIAIGNSLADPILAPAISTTGHVFLMILVLSTSEAALQRQAIRETWTSLRDLNFKGRRPNEQHSKLVFVLGGLDSMGEDLRKEHAEFNDLLIGSFQDTYRNLVLKVIVGLNWASTQNCSYILKADDDVYINLPRLTKWLETPGLPSRLYAGEVVVKNRVMRWPPWEKYRLSRAVYGLEYFPPYCRGAFYVFARAALPDMLEEIRKRDALPIEDAYLGIVAQKIGIVPSQIDGCKSRRSIRNQIAQWSDSAIQSMICAGDSFDGSTLRMIHYKLLYLSSKKT